MGYYKTSISECNVQALNINYKSGLALCHLSNLPIGNDFMVYILVGPHVPFPHKLRIPFYKLYIVAPFF